MRSTKDQLVKKRRSYACETQCFPVEPSGCRRGQCLHMIEKLSSSEKLYVKSLCICRIVLVCSVFLYVSDSPLVSMKKEKRDVPLRTAYSQAGRLWHAAKAKQSSRAGASNY
ncbi:hypothetical protein TNCV_3581981 [Trichonephila clavipes]|nr:hypothetical protein TNCV_3581981 [Trichonephila clavipes]